MEVDVAAWVADPSQNFGWVLVGLEVLPARVGDFATSKRFDSREIASGGGIPPTLEITYEPPVPVVLQRFVVDGD
jgi:hypothetical protein